ncbi:MAG: M20/M25/M40 family metallo-hydrolase, partial [bacterium]|nr:M20/M25/M40 family metallo-hydrolase [bacterium]
DVAGIVQMLETIRVLQEDNLPHGEIEFLFTVAEEGGLAGVKNFDLGKVKSKLGYFLDGGGCVGTIITQAPAQTKITANIHGPPSTRWNRT